VAKARPSLHRSTVWFVPADHSPVLPLLMNGEPKNVEEVCVGLKMPQKTSNIEARVEDRIQRLRQLLHAHCIKRRP
jgi:hypothetical protein